MFRQMLFASYCAALGVELTSYSDAVRELRSLGVPGPAS